MKICIQFFGAGLLVWSLSLFVFLFHCERVWFSLHFTRASIKKLSISPSLVVFVRACVLSTTSAAATRTNNKNVEKILTFDGIILCVNPTIVAQHLHLIANRGLCIVVRRTWHVGH
jgi:hypothetical protein